MTQKRNLDLDKILDRATELIGEQGLAAITMPVLARALNVRSQSLYHYVSGRKQLLSLVGARQIRVLRKQLMNNLIGLSGRDALLKFADIVRNFLLSDPALSSILYHLNEYPKDAPISQEILDLIRLGEKLNFRKESAISFHALIGAVLGFVFLDNSSSFADETKDESNRNYHEMILRLVEPVADLQKIGRK
ncbi:TetR/AcrR family transcriptional regulator [Lactobacillus kefiranofaciens]|uniref:TetR/AcrR family transcriptional regulator n=1 Tax=Lactobacillus kefiranofaciens TaxID=267818 RepID=A0AAX3UD64_9LACO|nr:TetR/AcrR family transcriptional regulator [Lactobacillus kefiranofaciens]AEG40907.1 possible transcriptional regulator [Lactobacillus kefiranofaciens subsp. kefiranofaciens]MCJ2172246.1 TetR/AcrR family transcriptional regulator [Lactobacillus kefiranofaciens]MCP9331124.1 TetR/AcrR family transcriptional regulator [Lactobacillus kefiranofaciens]MDF4142599.1 TetR/AcrR family transcriptional regulator [Lactobacillus kefiranofaciens]MDH5101048.1 TetR/AcrR family transcriptional regulator [Lac